MQYDSVLRPHYKGWYFRRYIIRINFKTEPAMNRQLSEQDLFSVLSVFSKHLFWEKHAYLINKGSFQMELLTTLSLKKNPTNFEN